MSPEPRVEEEPQTAEGVALRFVDVALLATAARRTSKCGCGLLASRISATSERSRR